MCQWHTWYRWQAWISMLASRAFLALSETHLNITWNPTGIFLHPNLNNICMLPYARSGIHQRLVHVSKLLLWLGVVQLVSTDYSIASSCTIIQITQQIWFEPQSRRPIIWKQLFRTKWVICWVHAMNSIITLSSLIRFGVPKVEITGNQKAIMQYVNYKEDIWNCSQRVDIQ